MHFTQFTPSLLLPAYEYRRERWKNGSGWTREILALPSTTGWTLRLSIAEIESASAYSAFPGVLREQVLLSGNGLRLDFDAGETVELLPPHDRVRFDGRRAVTGAPLDGPAQAFNLMWRPHALAATLLHRPLVGGMFCFADVDTAWAVHLLGGTARITGQDVDFRLEGGDTAWLAAGRRQRFAVDGAGEALMVRVDLAGGSGDGAG